MWGGYEGVFALALDTSPPSDFETLIRESRIELPDLEHGIRCGAFAATLFDGLMGWLALEESDRHLAIVAALFHDAGYARGGRDHHRKSYDVILESAIPGLSPQDRVIAACAARYHGSTVPNIEHAGFADLSFADQRRVRRLAAIVQLAAALDVSHLGIVTRVEVVVDGQSATVVAHALEEPSVERDRLREAAGRFHHLTQGQVRTRIVVR